MFGKLFGGGKAAKPMRLVPLSEAGATFFMEVLCDGWVAFDVPSLAALVEQLRALQQARPHRRVLATLENLGQASYTCGHATMANDLDRVLRSSAPNAPPEWFEDCYDEGEVSGAEGFPYRLRNLLALAQGVALDDMRGFLPWADPDFAGNDPLSLNTDPDPFLMLPKEREVLIQCVPVRRAADALAAFPNGYFKPDLSPMQNHMLACTLEERHGLALFGIGSSTLAFWRDTPLSLDEAAQVAALVAMLYFDRPADAVDLLAEAITGRDVILLRYTES